MTANSVAALVAQLRARVTSAEEGSIWAVYLDANDQPLLATAIHDGMAHLDDQAVHTLAYLVGHVGAHGALIAIPRAGGAPYDADRALWRQLRALTVDSRTALLDLVVIGNRSWWSAATDVSTPSVAA